MTRRDKWILTGILAALAAAWLVFLPGCPIRNLTGIPCPGCGMSRAWALALELDLAGALEMHPMFWSLPVVFRLFWTDLRLFGRRWAGVALLALITMGMLVCYACRMYYGLIN